MGLNISGLVIDKNYHDDITQLEGILGEKLHFEKEVPFEEASENWKEEEYCDVYFSEKGTLVFIAMAQAAFEFSVQQQKAFSFALSEMTMTFVVNYTDNGKMIRSFVETDEEGRHDEIGEKLPFEENEDDASELIHHLIEKTLGESFWNIDLEKTCFRYRFENQTVADTPASSTEKPWWKFW